MDGEKGKENDGKNDEKKKVSAPKSFYLFIQSHVSEGRGAKKKEKWGRKKKKWVDPCLSLSWEEEEEGRKPLKKYVRPRFKNEKQKSKRKRKKEKRAWKR